MRSSLFFLGMIVLGFLTPMQLHSQLSVVAKINVNECLTCLHAASLLDTVSKTWPLEVRFRSASRRYAKRFLTEQLGLDTTLVRAVYDDSLYSTMSVYPESYVELKFGDDALHTVPIRELPGQLESILAFRAYRTFDTIADFQGIDPPSNLLETVAVSGQGEMQMLFLDRLFGVLYAWDASSGDLRLLHPKSWLDETQLALTLGIDTLLRARYADLLSQYDKKEPSVAQIGFKSDTLVLLGALGNLRVEGKQAYLEDLPFVAYYIDGKVSRVLPLDMPSSSDYGIDQEGALFFDASGFLHLSVFKDKVTRKNHVLARYAEQGGRYVCQGFPDVYWPKALTKKKMAYAYNLVRQRDGLLFFELDADVYDLSSGQKWRLPFNRKNDLSQNPDNPLVYRIFDIRRQPGYWVLCFSMDGTTFVAYTYPGAEQPFFVSRIAYTKDLLTRPAFDDGGRLYYIDQDLRLISAH